MAGTHIVAMALVAAMTAPALTLRQEFAWLELTERLERAALAGSGQELRAVRIDLLRQLVRPAEQAPEQSLLEYAIAYVGYRLANRGEVPEQEQADLVDDAVERLESLVNDDPEYAEAHALLGSLYGLQSVFDRLDEPLVLLDRELDTIRDYLKIEQVRFEDRLRFTIDADRATGQVTVPPFLLQPLVENAVKYGIQPHTRQGEVRVTAHRGGGRVHIAVSDTGNGPNSSHGTGGKGIDLTRRRLRATYGDGGAVLRMSDGESEGFTVSLDLPAEPERRGFSSSAVNVS